MLPSEMFFQRLKLSGSTLPSTALELQTWFLSELRSAYLDSEDATVVRHLVQMESTNRFPVRLRTNVSISGAKPHLHEGIKMSGEFRMIEKKPDLLDNPAGTS